MQDKKVEIFIFTHKKFNNPKIDSYTPIQVGYDKDLGFIRDNTKENISEKNKNYCELTAIYWIWKNIKTKIVGSTHYRRFFSSNIFYPKILNTKKIEKILEKYDIIVPVPTYLLNENVQEQYSKKHHLKDLQLCRKVIEEKYDDYVKDFDEIMKRHYFYPYNMFIAKKELFDKYAEWLFDILFEVENRNDISNYSDYNQRIYGFLAERLFNVWLLHHTELEKKEVLIFNSENKRSELFLWNVKNNIKKFLVSIKSNIWRN